MNLPEGFKLEEQKPSLPEGFKLEEQRLNLPTGFKLEATPDELGRFIAEPGQETKTSNPFMGLVARASSLAGEGVEAVARVAENLGDKLETALPLTNLTPEQIQNEKQLQPMFQWADALRNYGKDIGYAPSTQLGEIPGKPLLLVPFIAERVISSAPDMAAAVLAAPAYVMARTNEILNDRLTNDKKELKDATVADVTAAVGAAVLETTLERFATKGLLKTKFGAEASTGARRIGKETAIQSGTEAVEEGVGYLGGTAGTQKGVDAAELAQNMLEGAIVGGGLGAGVQGAKEYVTKKERAKLEEILEPDLEAKLGRKPTEVELGGFVDTFLNERKRAQDAEKEVKDEREIESGVDAGRVEPSVPLSEQQKAGEPATGTTTSAPGSVGGDTGLANKPGVGKETQPAALTEDEIVAKAQEFQAKRQTLLTPTGRIPLANSKKGREYQALIVAEEDFVRNANAQRRAAAPQEAGVTPEITPVDTYFDTKKELQAKYDELQAAYDTTDDKIYDPYNPAKLSEDERDALKAENEANSKERDSILAQLESLKFPKEEAAVTETNAATAKEGEVEVAEDTADKPDSPVIQAQISTAPTETTQAVETETEVTPEEVNPVVAELSALSSQRQMAIDQGDQVGARQLLQQMGALRKDLPEDHPLHVTPEGKKKVVLTKAQRKAAAKKAPEPKAVANSSPRVEEVKNDVMFKSAHPTVLDAIKNNDLQSALKALKNTGGKFLANFADRLLQLNLDTKIGFDLQYGLVDKYLKNTEQQRIRVLMFLEIFHPDIFNDHFNQRKMHTPVIQMSESFYKLKTGKFNVDMRGFEEDLKDITKAFSKGLNALAAPGMFYNRTASFNTATGPTTNHTFVHEVTHAASYWAISNEHLLDQTQKKALANLKELFNYAKENAKDQSVYGYTDLHEFVSEALSNPKFQRELRAMKYAMDSNQSAWSKFIQFVYGLVGGDNVLFHTMANADVLFSANTDTDSNISSPMLAPDKYNVSKNGNFKVNTSERFSLGNLFKALRAGKLSWSDINKKNLSKFLDTTNQQYRRYLLGGLTLDQLTDIVGTELPQFQQYVREVDAMINTRNQILSEGEGAIRDWSRLQETNQPKAEQLAKMMLEATLNKMDPDVMEPQLKTVAKSGLSGPLKEYHDNTALRKAWQDMVSGPDGDKALSIYQEVRKFYERRAEEYVNIQLNRLREREEARGTDEADIKTKVDAERKELTKEMIQPYFPIKRFGDYWLQSGKGKKKIFMQFEDAWSRDLALEERRQELIDGGMTEEMADNELDSGQGFSEGFGQRLADVEHLKKLKDRVDAESDNILASTDPAVKADEVNSLRDALKDGFDQYYLETLPAQSIQKMFLHRKNVAGASIDMLRAFAVSRQRVAYQRARFQHMPALFNKIEGARTFLKTVPFAERNRLRDYVNELELNLKNAILEPPKQSSLTTGLTQFGFLHFLTSPASAIINALAIPGIYIPNAAPKYGMANTTKALAKYNRLLGGTGWRNDENGRVEFLSLSRAGLENVTFTGTEDNQIALPAGKSLADVYNEGVRRGVIDTTLTHEAASIGEQPSNEYTGKWQKFMYYASLPFHSAEKYNRETAFMSSFELAYNKYMVPVSKGGKGFTAEKAYDAAVQDARDLTQKTMFNYNTINKPRYFRGDLRNIFLQFKMYPQHMTILMYRTLHQAIGIGQDLELKKFEESLKTAPAAERDAAIKQKKAELKLEKNEAIKTFTGMMAFTFASAGITGLPLFFVFQGVASAFHAAFGDDDEPFDSENWFKNWCNRTFGGFAGDIMSRGIASKVTGINFADRMGINLTDMWFPDVRKSQDEVQYVQNLMTNLMGPTVGAGMGYIKAIKDYRDGYSERAIEGMMPAAIKNVMVGTRYLTEGKAMTMKGATLDENVTPAEALAQMLGFSPEDTAQKQKATFEMKNTNEVIITRHNDLLNAFFIAVDGHDTVMMAKVLEKIQRFNKANPGVAIDGNSIVNSVQRKYQDRALANITGGMPINKKLIGQLNGMREYSQ
jgi:hypothetical protein